MHTSDAMLLAIFAVCIWVQGRHPLRPHCHHCRGTFDRHCKQHGIEVSWRSCCVSQHEWGVRNVSPQIFKVICISCWWYGVTVCHIPEAGFGTLHESSSSSSSSMIKAAVPHRHPVACWGTKAIFCRWLHADSGLRWSQWWTTGRTICWILKSLTIDDCSDDLTILDRIFLQKNCFMSQALSNVI